MVTETPSFRDGEGFGDDEREVYRCTDQLGHMIVTDRLQAVADLNATREAGRELAKTGLCRVEWNGGSIDLTLAWLSSTNASPVRVYRIDMCRPRVSRCNGSSVTSE